MKFEWDLAREAANLAKHGVDFSKVPDAFADKQRLFLRIPGLGAAETRWQLVGFDGVGIITVRFTLRRGWVRVIGAGYWRKQKQIYEKENQIHR